MNSVATAASRQSEAHLVGQVFPGPGANCVPSAMRRMGPVEQNSTRVNKEHGVLMKGGDANAERATIINGWVFFYFA